MRFSALFAALAVTFITSVPAQALESYPAQLTSQFVSWCTTAQNQPQTVCSCAVSQASAQIPAVSMASFLNAPEGAGMTSASQSVGVAALQIVTTCAAASASSGTSGKSLMNSLGGFGQ